MPDATISELGKLSTLPREIRDKIYSYVLNFTYRRAPWELPAPPSMLPKPTFNDPTLRTSLLRTSRTIHSEASIILYQVNEFGIWIDYDYRSNRDNKSIMGRPGYRVDFGLQEEYREKMEECFFKDPPKMEYLRHMQLIHLQVGTHWGIREYDLVPTKHQTVSGPERPTFKGLIKVVEEVCEKLKECHQIHILRVSIRSIEKTPGNIENVMDPIRNLRGVKHTNPVVFAMQEDKWVDWNLKGSYGRYLNRIMAMPEGTKAPKYVGDEKEPDQSEKNIFDMVGGKWLGGRSFAMPMEDDTEDDTEDHDEADEEDVGNEDDEDAWVGEEDDDFEAFMDALNNRDFEQAFNITHGGLSVPSFAVPPVFLEDDDLGGPLLGTFMPTNGLANANAVPVPGLHEPLFGPGPHDLYSHFSGYRHHHPHHHHSHHSHYDDDDEMPPLEGEAPEAEDALSMDRSLD